MSANLQSTSNALKDANPATNKEAEPTPNPQAEKPADPITNQGNQTQAAAKQPTAPKPKPPKKQTKASGTPEDPTQDSPGKPAKETQEADREKGLQMVLGTKHIIDVDNPNANVTNNKMSRVERLQEEAMAEMWETAQAAKKAGDHDKAKLYHAGATGPTGKAGSSGGNHSNGKGAANQQRAQSPHDQQGSGLGRYSRSQGYKGNRYDAAYDERGDRGRRKDQRGRN
ncbi:hypothetical protein PtA15_8A68 [Puccinia triticina]|uniref:Hyaluronan/mRNA-binding protein domain-containing protein n=1 Tax=Puccinia triticina TaxID=208348 RepID=A0ABY7CT67_9BASI|nr:uncharacterized protein PtA15_8A68 [Puccinia triticina]WAQ87167.1 hypothetical protein PtA15_8A68 [Puccinia triticina]